MGPRWVRVVWVNLKIGVLSTSRHRWLRIGIRVPMDPQISTKQAIHGEVDGFDLFDPQIDDAQHDQSHVLASFDEIF